MALTLGVDGKLRALSAGCGAAQDALGTLYVGLLSDLPSDPDIVDFGSLMEDEFNVTDFYVDDRREIELAEPTIEDGLALVVYDGDDIVWTNDSGDEVEIQGLFITDAATGDSGSILWVGAPDSGGVTFGDGDDVVISTGALRLRVD